MSDANIPVVIEDLPTTIHGFCCLGEDYEPCIILNSRLSIEQQKEAYLHELHHISSGELDDMGYREYD